MTPGWVRQGRGGRDRVGEHGEVEVGREQLDDGLGGGARVEQYGAAGGQLVEHAGGDAALDVGEAAGAGGEGGLELEPLDGDGAAVHPAQRAAALEGGEVAADGLGGDPEGVGEEGDLHPAGLAGLRHDPLLPLRCVHRDSFVLTGAPRWADVDHQTTGTGQCKEIRAPVFVAFAPIEWIPAGPYGGRP